MKKIQEIQDYKKRGHIHLTGIHEREGERISNLKSVFEDIIHKNFSNLTKELNMQIQEIKKTLTSAVPDDPPQGT